MSTRIQSPEQEVVRSEEETVKHQWNWSIIGAITMAFISLMGLAVVGRVNDATQAQDMIDAMSAPLQMLAFASVTATVTILVLTLTMLTIMKELEVSFSKQFYTVIERMGLLATIGLVMGVLLLTLLSIPFQDAHTDVAEQWSVPVYYILVFINAVVSGLLVALILMLFDAVKSIIRTFRVQEDVEGE